MNIRFVSASFLLFLNLEILDRHEDNSFRIFQNISVGYNQHILSHANTASLRFNEESERRFY